MEKNLADVIAELNTAKKTGMLSVGLKGDASLFKIFFRDGAIYHITHGSCRNMECLADLGRLQTDTGFFMPDAHVDTATPLTASTGEIVGRIRELGKTIRWSTGPAASEAQAQAGTIVDPGVIASMEEELINLVGPVGSMLIERVYAECGSKRGTPVPKRDFRKLVECIGKQLPEDQKKIFLGRFNK